MHELGIARDLWKAVEEKARNSNFKKITKVTIKLGEASGIDEDLLRHSLLDHIFPKTIAKNSKLDLIKEDVKSKCSKCGRELTKENMSDIKCPHCGSLDIEVLAGKDVYVENIEGK